jgi:hypothetical protein
LAEEISAPQGPQEGTPEFEAEMEAWGALNDELKADGAVLYAAGPRRRRVI